MIKSALLVLGDGTQFHGRIIGVTGTTIRGVIFSTSMIGYQEILTNPSYSRQIVALTYPRIGNVGANTVGEESPQVHTQDLTIRDLPLIVSNFRNTGDLSSYLKRHSIIAITDTDTRKLARLLHERGAQNGCIVVGDNPDAQLALERAKAFPDLSDIDLAKEVTTAETYSWTQDGRTLTGDLPEVKTENELPFHVVAYNFGAKHSILCMPVDRGYRLAVVPTRTSAEDVLKVNPDGISLSNGPGDPAPCDYAIDAIEKLLEADIPVFSICLGHQLLALASGAKTIKMKFDHHGGNHPMKDIDSDMVMIIVQDHGFTVDEATLSANLHVTHKSLLDGTLQGTHRTDRPAFSFQGCPEVSPGSHDTAPLFDHFIELVKLYHQPVK